ncbi:MAG TPA: AbrB family transcriptional regulator [Clostridium sp.]|nr:AbrB family transcriptional regulator [Clostridium sp.]
MNDEGIIRNLDNMGRIVIPKEMRKVLKVMNGDKVRIIKDNNTVVIKKAADNCFLCGSENNLIEYKDVYICKKCVKEMERRV